MTEDLQHFIIMSYSDLDPKKKIFAKIVTTRLLFYSIHSTQ